MQQLLTEKENVNRQYESLREIIDSKHERIKDLAQSRVENAQAAVGPADVMMDSRTAYALSLYTKISNITWNYENDEGFSGCKFSNISI